MPECVQFWLWCWGGGGLDLPPQWLAFAYGLEVKNTSKKVGFHFKKPRRGLGRGYACHPLLICHFTPITEEDIAGGEDSCSQSERQWQKVLSSPNLWTDMTLILH